SAREVLALHCRLAGLPRSTWQPELDHALRTVGLTDRAGDRVNTFSKGMQQRLGLGVALLGKPDLVLLDEPTSALDPVGRQDVREILLALKARGTTVFLNSHLLSEVEKVCDRVAVVDHGRVIAIGTLDDLLGENAVRLRVAGLNGAHRAELARFGEIREEGDWLTVRGLGLEGVPDLVATLIRMGGRVYAVEQVRGVAFALTTLLAFMFSFVLALSAAFTGSSSIASEVESGIAQAILARPISRTEVVLGKWLGFTVLITVYAAVVSVIELGLVAWITGYAAPHVAPFIAFLAAEGMVLMSMALLFSTRLS